MYLSLVFLFSSLVFFHPVFTAPPTNNAIASALKHFEDYGPKYGDHVRIVSFDFGAHWYLADSKDIGNGHQEVILVSFDWRNRLHRPPRKENSMDWNDEAPISEWTHPEPAMIELDLKSPEVVAQIQASRQTHGPIDLGPSHHNGQLLVAYNKQYAAGGGGSSKGRKGRPRKLRRPKTCQAHVFRPSSFGWTMEPFYYGKLTSTPDPYAHQAQQSVLHYGSSSRQGRF